jgi:hypothetical protein
MIFVNDVKYVKVFKVEDKGNYIKAQVNTSEKKQDGTYENSSWFVTFVGNCKDEAKRIAEGDKITIKKAKLTNVYNKEHKKSYLNFTVFAFEFESQKAQNDFSDFAELDDGSDLPF